MDEIDTTNKFVVSVNSDDKLLIIGWTKLNRQITKDDALNLAAWLVALADDHSEPKFGKLLRAVLET